jgi:translation initiation factor IF-1
MHAVRMCRRCQPPLPAAADPRLPAPPSLAPPTTAQVEFPDGRTTLCLMPAKFHKKLWIKNGNYLIVEEEAGAEGRVTGQILAVLFTDHVKQLRKMPGVW